MILDLFKSGYNFINALSNSKALVFSSDFSQQLDEDEKALKSFQKEVANGAAKVVAIDSAMGNASNVAREYANSHKITNEEIQSFITSQRQSQVTIAASNSSLKTQSSIINAYKYNLEKLGLEKNDFIDAVKKGNINLGNYLSTVKSGKASMGGYVLSLIKAKAATIALNVATTLLNAGLTMLISIGVSAIFNVISEAANKAKERISEAANSIDDLNESLKTLDDYKKRSAELREELDKGGLSLSEVTEKRKELFEIQKELTDKYGAEAKGIDTVTTSVKEQAEAYEELNDQINQTWISKNRQAIEDAENNIYEGYREWDYLEDGAYVILGDDYSQNAEATYFTEWLNDWISNRDKIGKTVNEKYEYQITFDGSKKEIIKNIDALESAIEEYLDSADIQFEDERTNAQAILDALSDKRDQIADESYIESEKVYEQAVEIIAKSKGEYKTYYADLLKLDKEYNDAIVKGDEEAAQKSYQAIVDKYNEIINNGNFIDTEHVRGEDIKAYFESQLQDFINIAVPVRLQIDIEATDREFKSTKGELTRLYSLVGDEGFDLSYSRGVPSYVIGHSNVSPEQAEDFNAIRDAAEQAGVSIESYIDALVQYDKVRDDTLTENSGQKLTAMLTEYSDALTKLKTAYDLADEAEKEMIDGGLSPETVKKLSDANEEYIDYLYEENGVIKLNTKAWKENADEGVRNQMSTIQESQNTLSQEKERLKDAADAVEYYNSVLKEAENLGVTSDKTLFGNIDTNNRRKRQIPIVFLRKFLKSIISSK